MFISADLPPPPPPAHVRPFERAEGGKLGWYRRYLAWRHRAYAEKEEHIARAEDMRVQRESAAFRAYIGGIVIDDTGTPLDDLRRPSRRERQEAVARLALCDDADTCIVIIAGEDQSLDLQNGPGAHYKEYISLVAQKKIRANIIYLVSGSEYPTQAEPFVSAEEIIQHNANVLLHVFDQMKSTRTLIFDTFSRGYGQYERFCSDALRDGLPLVDAERLRNLQHIYALCIDPVRYYEEGKRVPLVRRFAGPQSPHVTSIGYVQEDKGWRDVDIANNVLRPRRKREGRTERVVSLDKHGKNIGHEDMDDILTPHLRRAIEKMSRGTFDVDEHLASLQEHFPGARERKEE